MKLYRFLKMHIVCTCSSINFTVFSISTSSSSAYKSWPLLISKYESPKQGVCAAIVKKHRNTGSLFINTNLIQITMSVPVENQVNL